MAKEHSILRSGMDSLEEAHRLTERYNKRDVSFKMTADDLHTIRGAASMAHQAARSLSELTGFLEAKLDGK